MPATENREIITLHNTTLQGSVAVISAIKSVINKKIDVHSLQSYLN